MSKVQCDDYYEQLERIERELTPLMEGERIAFERLMTTPREQREPLLERYFTAVALAEGAMAKRRRFLETYRP